MAKPKCNDKVLDLGCGFRTYTKFFKDNSFDVIYLIKALEHVPDDREVLKARIYHTRGLYKLLSKRKFTIKTINYIPPLFEGQFFKSKKLQIILERQRN